MPAALLLIPLIPALIGGIFLTVATTMRRHVQGWVSTQGLVVEHSGLMMPVFVFRDHRGAEHRVRMVRGSDGFPPSVGTVVPVRYDPQAPARARIDTPGYSGVVYVWVGWVLVGIAVAAEVVLASAYVATR